MVFVCSLASDSIELEMRGDGCDPYSKLVVLKFSCAAKKSQGQLRNVVILNISLGVF